jgi:hypothetical protein
VSYRAVPAAQIDALLTVVAAWRAFGLPIESTPMSVGGHK